jgi:hypothetical protein
MRPILRAWLVFAVTCLLASATMSGAWAQDSWVSFVHPQYGFSLQYPPDWLRAQAPPPVLIQLLGPPSASRQRGRIGVNIGSPSILSQSANAESFANLMNSVLPRVLDRYTPDRREAVQLGATQGVLQHYTYNAVPGLRYYEVALYVVAPPNLGWIVKGTTDADSMRLSEEIALLLSVLMTFRLSAP